MDYPLLIAGQEKGRLSVEKEGLFTVFEARCSPITELLKISVYGGGREGYLGLMQPWKGGLYLRRKLSRSQMKDFPERIEYAAEAGLHIQAFADEECEALPEKADEPEGLLWFRRADGSLVCEDGESRLIALPARLRHVPPKAVIREIEGESYILFRY